MKNAALGIICWYLFASSSVSLADTYSDFADYREPDSIGRHYVVVQSVSMPRNGTNGPVMITIAERANKDASPIKASIVDIESKKGVYRITNKREVKVAAGDIVHSQVRLSYTPTIVRVSSTGLGIAVLDYWATNYRQLKEGDALRIYSMKGELRTAIKLNDLFFAGLRSYHDGMGRVRWIGGVWFDEENSELVVVASNFQQSPATRKIAIVDLKSGKLRRGSKKDIERAIIRHNLGALSDALEIARDMRLNHLKNHLPAILNDKKMSLPIRLRAASFLVSLGDNRGLGLLKQTASVKNEEVILPSGYYWWDTVGYSQTELWKLSELEQ